VEHKGSAGAPPDFYCPRPFVARMVKELDLLESMMVAG
jgi:hypothetical protein